MEEIQLTKEYVEELIKMQGKIRGLVLTTLRDYIANKKGGGSIIKIEKRMKELGYPLDFSQISSVKWYPASLITIAMLAVLDTFHWGGKENFQLGYEAPITSILAKLMLRTFTSLNAAFAVTPKFWKNYTDLGEMKWIKTNMEKKEAVLRLSNYPKVHPVFYEYFRGYLKRIMEIMVKTKNVEVKITKSIFKDDPYDEFTFTW
jgi:hypothetical protein